MITVRIALISACRIQGTWLPKHGPTTSDLFQLIRDENSIYISDTLCSCLNDKMRPSLSISIYPVNYFTIFIILMFMGKDNFWNRYVSKDEGSILSNYLHRGFRWLYKDSFQPDFSICPNLIAVNIVVLFFFFYWNK